MLEQTQPGCFGLPSLYAPNDERCRTCPAFKDCRTQAAKLLPAMTPLIDTGPLAMKLDEVPQRTTARKKPKRTGKLAHELTPLQAALVAKMPDRTRKIATTILKRGIHIRAAIVQQYNPFNAHGPAFLREPMQLLIDGKSLTKPAIISRYRQTNPQWSSKTADANAMMAIRILSELQVINEDGYVRH